MRNRTSQTAKSLRRIGAQAEFDHAYWGKMVSKVGPIGMDTRS